MKFRIKEVEDIGFFAQVREMGFWKTIVWLERSRKFLKFSPSDMDFRLSENTFMRAKNLCRKYKNFKKPKRDRKVTYTYIDGDKL